MAKKEAETDRRKQLEKDISSYISDRRKGEKGFLKAISSIFKGGDDVEVKLHPEVDTYGEDKGKKAEPEEKKEEKAEEEMEELEEEFNEGAKPGFFGKIKNFFFEEEQAKEGSDVSPEEVEKVIEEKRKKEEVREEEAQEEEADSELEEEYDEGAREKGLIAGFLEKLFGKASAEKNVCADEIAEAIDTVDDLKKVAEISTKVMKMLPSDQVKELKAGDDFKDFKDILKKHNLIK